MLLFGHLIDGPLTLKNPLSVNSGERMQEKEAWQAWKDHKNTQKGSKSLNSKPIPKLNSGVISDTVCKGKVT